MTRHYRESAEQRALFKWAAARSATAPDLGLMFAIPNGGPRSGHPGILTAEGVKRGVPDICLPVARDRYHGLWIEMKAGRGKLTADQTRWLTMLQKQGYMVFLAYGWAEAAEVIEAYLEIERTVGV